MQRTVAQNLITAVRIVWVSLMIIFAALIFTNQIGGFATSILAVVILGVMGAEYALKRKNTKND